ncbi:site-specific integrase [Crossiella sp. SN42]|uniref:site-specific integrase n=1 Tax=Crossiella sp. SN42 TaxID=2944808 RepID=UPI00207CFE7D|nr:site-specific integrase [Crossiella sp. SN42]MCO1575145.1 site-specific integrase [Crossiella sp. SN42]
MTSRDTDGWELVWTEAASQPPAGFDRALDEFLDISEREAALDIAPRTPILVSPAGEIDDQLIEFFTSPSFASLSQATREGYAKDIRLLVAHFAARGIDWTEATTEDLRLFKVWRRRRDLNERAVSGAKWARENAAFTKLYTWASAPSRRHVECNPIEYETVYVGRGKTVESSTLSDPDAVTTRVVWATPRTYRLWRDVGLLGYQVDGTRDEKWRGRLASRNRAYADLLFGSGLRNKEASSLLTVEIPTPGDEGPLQSAWLGREVAKRRGRTFYILEDAVSRIQEYVRLSRRAAVSRARRAGRYEGPGLIWVSQVRATGRGMALRIDGRNHSLDDLAPAMRQRLMRRTAEGPEPLWLWLSEAGAPLAPESWDGVFDAANERVARMLGEVGKTPVHLTAHSLRHSYALYMLITLHRAIDLQRGHVPDQGYDEDRYRQAWDIVRDLLGHRSTETTRSIYLEPVNGVRMTDLLGQDGDLDTVLGRLAAVEPRVRDLAAGTR